MTALERERKRRRWPRHLRRTVSQVGSLVSPHRKKLAGEITGFLKGVRPSAVTGGIVRSSLPARVPQRERATFYRSICAADDSGIPLDKGSRIGLSDRSLPRSFQSNHLKLD